MQHATIDDGRRELKLCHTASNDDGQEAELCPAAEELKSGDSSYTPNTSWRIPARPKDVEIPHSCPESVGPVKEHRNDWRELWNLTQAAVFETLKMILLIWLAIV